MLARFGLDALAQRQVGGLSGGERRRVAVALAFAGRPRLVVLDEPTAGLDLVARRAVWDAVRAHAAEGGTILLTTHYLEEADALATRVVLIDAGRIVADGTVASIKAAAGLARVSFRAPPGAAIDGAERDGDARAHPDGRRGRDGREPRPRERAARRSRGAAADARGIHRRARGRSMRLVLLHARATTLELLRYPAFLVPTLAFPAVFFLFFVAPRTQAAASVEMATFAGFAVIGVAFFQFGVGIAVERASPWETYLRTLPVGPGDAPRGARALGGRVRGRRRRRSSSPSQC